MSIENEQEIIARAKNGDEKAMNILVEEYAPVVFRFSFHVCRNREKAENTTQEAFLSILRKLHQFDNRSKFSTWVYSIVANHCLMAARKNKSNRFVSLDDETVHVPDAGSDTAGPLERMEQDEIRTSLDRAIKSLSPEYRVVFILRDIEGLSSQEVGRITGLSVAAVKSRLHRARKHLREQLSPMFEE